MRVAVEETRRRGGEAADSAGSESLRGAELTYTFRALAFVVPRLAHVPQ